MDLSAEQLAKYKGKYDLLEEKDLQECAAVADDWRTFEFMTASLQEDRESEMQYGTRHVLTEPLLHVLSAKVKSKKDGQLAIYGVIYATYRDRSRYPVKYELFKREKDAPQIVGNDGDLPLKGPDFSCEIICGCMPLNRGMRMVIRLFNQTGEKFTHKSFDLSTLDARIHYKNYEEVVSFDLGAITLECILIPHGVSCRMNIKVWPRHSKDSFDVSGRIAAKYTNPYGHGDPFSTECVLFDKQGPESERVIIDTWKLNLSRCWLALSAYSALVVDVDLSLISTDQKSDQKIVGTAKMFPDNGWASSDTIVVDDYIVMVNAAWFSPRSFPFPIRQKQLSPPLPSPSPGLEIFSVFIGFGLGRTTEEEVARVYGSIEVLVGGDTICSIFKKDDKNALKIVSNRDSIPLLDGSRVFGKHMRLEMKVDVKDVDSSLAIKGNVDWDAEILDTGSWYGKILCSIIRGQSGFVALHYAIFPKAVEAEIKVDLYVHPRPKRGRVFMGLTAQYGCFDYKLDYNHRYHRIVLFKDFIDVLSSSWHDTVELSRSKIVVPSHSSLVFELMYGFAEGDHPVIDEIKFCKIEIGEGSKKVKVAKSTAQIEIEWREVQ